MIAPKPSQHAGPALLLIVGLMTSLGGYHLFSPSQSATATLSGNPLHPAQAANWVDTKLYFGLAPEGDTRRASSEAQWQDFLDHEVTARFPAGLSVIDVAGQWQGANNPAPVHVRTKLLVIDYPNTPENATKIEAIRTAWKQRTHDQSVLKVTQPADVSF